MKNLFYLPVFALASLLFVSCESDNPGPVDDPFAVKSVSLNKATHTMNIGDDVELEATILPETATNKNIIWSSDSDAATVVNGLVTGVKAGTAKIIAVSEDGEKSDTCVVTIEGIAVEGISLNKTEHSMFIGETLTLQPTIAPNNATNQNITWTSSNNSVATVVGGVVTPVDKGVATITATTTDGSNKSAKCNLSVGNDNVARSNIVWIVDSSKPDGGYLTFAVTEADNEQIPANAQGVFFKWGSLVALSPVKNYTPESILFSASGNKNYAWYDAGTPAIPYIGIYEVNPFNNSVNTEYDFRAYNGNTGFNESADLGDVCRYISSKGWVEGNWRMPSSLEYAILAGYSSDGSGAYSEDNREVLGAGSTFSQITVPAEGNNVNGFYKIPSGYFIGPGANANDSKENPKKGVIFFPAAGSLHISVGALYQVNVRGYLWSGSSAYSQMAYSLMCYDNSGLWYPEHYRTNAIPVRCIRDE